MTNQKSLIRHETLELDRKRLARVLYGLWQKEEKDRKENWGDDSFCPFLLEQSILDAHVAFQVMDGLKDVKEEDAIDWSECDEANLYRTVKMSEIDVNEIEEDALFGEAKNIDNSISYIEFGVKSLKNIGLFELYQLDNPLFELEWIIQTGRWAHKSMLIVATEFLNLYSEASPYERGEDGEELASSFVEGNQYFTLVDKDGNETLKPTKLGREKLKAIKDALREIRETKKELVAKVKNLANYVNCVGKEIKIQKAKSAFMDEEQSAYCPYNENGDRIDWRDEEGTKFEKQFTKKPRAEKGLLETIFGV